MTADEGGFTVRKIASERNRMDAVNPTVTRSNLLAAVKDETRLGKRF
jgi:hypothetical protein